MPAYVCQAPYFSLFCMGNYLNFHLLFVLHNANLKLAYKCGFKGEITRVLNIGRRQYCSGTSRHLIYHSAHDICTKSSPQSVSFWCLLVPPMLGRGWWTLEAPVLQTPTHRGVWGWPHTWLERNTIHTISKNKIPSQQKLATSLQNTSTCRVYH